MRGRSSEPEGKRNGEAAREPDAARERDAAREPEGARDRQGNEMPHVSDSAHHADHDQALIAAYAAGDAQGSALETAEAMVAACTACADLHRDLRAIRSAMADLPAPVRPRDFRLTAEQAAALRPVGWRGILSVLAGPRFSFAAPLGAALATMGLVGVLIAGPGGQVVPAGGGSTALSEAGGQGPAPMVPGPEATEAVGGDAYANATLAPAGSRAAGLASAAPSPAMVVGQAGGSPEPIASGNGSDLAAGGEAVGAPTAGNVASPPAASSKTDRGPATAAGPATSPQPAARPSGPGAALASDGAGRATAQLPLILAGALLVVGLVLGGLRLVARRVA